MTYSIRCKTAPVCSKAPLVLEDPRHNFQVRNTPRADDQAHGKARPFWSTLTMERPGEILWYEELATDSILCVLDTVHAFAWIKAKRLATERSAQHDRT